jgi:hypothetical protein
MLGPAFEIDCVGTPQWSARRNPSVLCFGSWASWAAAEAVDQQMVCCKLPHSSSEPQLEFTTCLLLPFQVTQELVG